MWVLGLTIGGDAGKLRSIPPLIECICASEDCGNSEHSQVLLELRFTGDALRGTGVKSRAPRRVRTIGLRPIEVRPNMRGLVGIEGVASDVPGVSRHAGGDQGRAEEGGDDCRFHDVVLVERSFGLSMSPPLIRIFLLHPSAFLLLSRPSSVSYTLWKIMRI